MRALLRSMDKLLDRRGFVIIVVMMLMAVATAVAVSQFSIVANQSVTSSRSEEQNQARVTAETCLDLLQRYAEGYIGTSPPGFNFADFDALLDRDGIANNNDDYLPSFGTRVLVPRNLTPTTGATAAMHQWAFLVRGSAPNQGGCLLRLEDNSDEGFPVSSVPVGTTGLNEGLLALSRDVTNRDRDRSIYLTAIGLFPVLPGTTADLAYERAHARVTLRRLYATNNPVQTPPAIQACDDVTIKGSADICGLGGVQADGITVAGGGTCGCGTYAGNTVTPSTPPSACGACPAPGTCQSPSVAVGPPPACTAPPIPNATYYMDNRGFAHPGLNNNNIGDPKSCKVYIDRVGRVYVWDMTDPYANDPAGPLAPEVTALRIPALPVHNCQNYRKDPVELPCVWDTTTADGDPESVTCDFLNANPKLRQTPCWKPIANIGDSSGTTPGVNMSMGSDVTYGSDPPNLYAGAGKFVPAGGRWTEMSSNENDEDLQFLKNVPIPNVRDATKRFATGLAGTTMCGDANGCQDCTGVSNNDWWTECSKRNGGGATGTQTTTCEDFHSHTHQNSNHIPWPIVFAWDVDPAFEINFEFEGAATKPLNATILTNGKIAFGNAVSFCCAECGTGGNCTTPSTSPGITSKFIPAANCKNGDPQIPNPTFAVPPPPPGPVTFVPSGYGYAFKADGVCDIAADSTVIGDVECQAISIPDDPCIVGNILVTGSSTTVGCTGLTACSPSANASAPNVGVCIGGASNLLGDIYSQGSVCATSSSTTKMQGDLFTMGNVSLQGGFTTTGQVFANQDVSVDGSAVINFVGGGQILSVGSQGLTTFMETSW